MISIRRSTRIPAGAMVLVWLAACAFAEGPSPEFDEKVQGEIARLDSAAEALAATDLHDQLKEGLKANRETLAKLRDVKSPLLRLYRLREPFVSIEAMAFVGAHPRVLGGEQTFDSLWDERKPQLESSSAESRGSMLRAALVEGAGNRAEKLFHASRPYAKASGAFSGLYYLGEAEGNRKFGAFVASLPDPGKAEAPPAPDALRAAQETLESETLELFEKDPASRATIPLSARLKESRELLESGRLAGATLAILESRLGLSRRRGVPPPSTSSRANARGTLADLYLAIEAEEDAPKPSFVRSDVLPLYTSLMRSRP